jgi:DNA-binding GntR family transcriptional regulator
MSSTSEAYNGPVEFRGKSDVIAATVREQIITGELAPGTPLRQRDLAAKFGVSPTPVREALRRLEAEGLVENDLHKGATVIQTGIDAEEEGYAVRAVLESQAARAAARRATDKDIAELRALHKQFADARAGHPSLPELNRRFHFRIYEASQSPVLLALLRLLWQSYHPGPAHGRPHGPSVKDHRGILDAIADGDEDAAEALTRAHIEGALQSFLKQKPQPGQPAAKPASRARTGRTKATRGG